MNPKDLAWLIVRKAIEEAFDRYGLPLHGRIEEGVNGFTLEFVCVPLNVWASQVIVHKFLTDEETAVMFLEIAVNPIIRRLAETRDLESRQNKRPLV